MGQERRGGKGEALTCVECFWAVHSDGDMVNTVLILKAKD